MARKDYRHCISLLSDLIAVLERTPSVHSLVSG